jgi:hypothetical protein
MAQAPGSDDEMSDDEVEQQRRRQRQTVRPELAELEDEEELNLDEPDSAPTGAAVRQDDYEDDEDSLQVSLTSASTYLVPIILAGPFYIFNVWRVCHWVVHRVISFPLDYVVTPLETNKKVKKSINVVGIVQR